MTKILEIPLRLTKYIALGLASLFCLTGAISWIAARETIVFIAPVLIWLMAGCAIVASLVGTAALVIERSAWLKTRRAEHNRDLILATNEAKKSNLEISRSRMHIKAEYKLMCVAVDQVQSGLIHPATLGDGAKFSSFPAAVVKHIDGGDTPLLESETRRDLLPALANCPNILIVGGKGRGKTHLIKWLEYKRMRDGNISTVLDSHSQPAKWAGQVIGAGRSYESIAAAMLDLNELLNKRYIKYSDGKNDFIIIDTYIDEFTLLPDKLKNIGFDIQSYSKPHLTEGRKIGLNCVWGSHSDRAKALGLEGATDLKECFDAIVYLKRIKRHNDQDDFYALVDFGEGIGEIKYNHPGPFTINRPTSPVKILSLPAPAVSPAAEPIAIQNWPKPDDNEREIMLTWKQMKDNGSLSGTALHQKVTGQQSRANAKQLQNLRDIISKFGQEPGF